MNEPVTWDVLLILGGGVLSLLLGIGGALTRWIVSRVDLAREELAQLRQELNNKTANNRVEAAQRYATHGELKETEQRLIDQGNARETRLTEHLKRIDRDVQQIRSDMRGQPSV